MKKTLGFALIILLAASIGYAFYLDSPGSVSVSAGGYLGDQNVESVTGNLSPNYSWGWRVQANASGSLGSAKIYNGVSGVYAANAVISIYTSSASSPQNSDALVGTSGSIARGSTIGWYASNFSSGTVTNGNYYWIFVSTSTGVNWAGISTPTSPTATIYYKSNSGWYASMPSTLNGITFSSQANFLPMSAWAGIGQ
jgi:hypothetical protein